MKVVALVSGGKDSTYSILCCAAHGHEVVALANLLPPDPSTDELDSYMYQTVGHQLVGAYAACTGLPLYRAAIRGTATRTALAYGAAPAAGDEVEDLAKLLAFVKARHPEIDAVASGAIASDYQRLRVEAVAARLGLASLAYLWHRRQAELLQSMIDAGIEAILVKVAALGLDPARHLGKTIAAMAPALRSLRARFGCNVCGEGGEYETMTLDCPAFARARVVLDAWEARSHSPDAVAPVGALHPTAFHIEPKEQLEGAGEATDAAAVVVEVPADWQPPQLVPSPLAAPLAAPVPASLPQNTKVAVRLTRHYAHLGCAAGDGGSDGTPEAATAAALDAALSAIGAKLPGLGLEWGDALFVHLYLRDMAHFAAANAVYCRHLPPSCPPSRACVQLPAPPAAGGGGGGGGGAAVAVDVLFALPDGGSSNAAAAAAAPRDLGARCPRRVLHVQSISDWAPSCIGPYSQATSARGLVHVAGQIPLDPGSMAVWAPSDARMQARLALAHAQSVAVAAGGCAAAACLGLTVYVAGAGAAPGTLSAARALVDELRADAVRFAARVERERLARVYGGGVCSGGGGADGDDKGSGSGGGGSGSVSGSGSESGSDDDGDALDDYLRPPATRARMRPPVVFLEVPALPRGALIEVQPLLLDVARGAADPPASSSSSDDEGDDKASDTNKAADAVSNPIADSVGEDAAAAAAGAHIEVHATESPSGAAARLLLRIDRAALADGPDVPALARAAAARLALAARQLPAPLSGRPFDSVRAWCAEVGSSGGVDSSSWAELLGAALETAHSGAPDAAAAAPAMVVGARVGSIWVSDGSGESSKGGDGLIECCIAVEALLCS